MTCEKDTGGFRVVAFSRISRTLSIFSKMALINAIVFVVFKILPCLFFSGKLIDELIKILKSAQPDILVFIFNTLLGTLMVLCKYI